MTDSPQDLFDLLPMTTRRGLKVLRTMAAAYQAFESLNRSQLRDSGLTPAQFDIVATLGNTGGMTFKSLGERTMISKGTLTGVVDRLVREGLVERVSGQADRRTVIVRLTRPGNKLFVKLFPDIAGRAANSLRGFSRRELDELDASLDRLRAAFEAQRLLEDGRHPHLQSSMASIE